MSDRSDAGGWADDGHDGPRERARDFAAEAQALVAELQAIMRSVEGGLAEHHGDLTGLKARIDQLADRYRVLSRNLAREAERAGGVTKH
jgi:hypothetical protein